jgi:hypothetical protein
MQSAKNRRAGNGLPSRFPALFSSFGFHAVRKDRFSSEAYQTAG